MAFRGRGGFGGRGRGRFGPSYIPQARGDDGQPMFAKKQDGPPPLFPPINLPDIADVTSTDLELVTRSRNLNEAWKSSPYFIEKPKEQTTGVAAEIERYSDKYKPNFKRKRPPLSSVLILTPAYFPAELIGNQDRRQSQYKGTAQWTLDKGDLNRLDKLASMEQRSQKAGDEGDDGKKKGEDDDDDEEELEEEGDDEFEEDDYAQNFGFDDDDEYLEDDDGGDDEGPTF